MSDAQRRCSVCQLELLHFLSNFIVQVIHANSMWVSSHRSSVRRQLGHRLVGMACKRNLTAQILITDALRVMERMLHSRRGENQSQP